MIQRLLHNLLGIKTKNKNNQSKEIMLMSTPSSPSMGMESTTSTPTTKRPTLELREYFCNLCVVEWTSASHSAFCLPILVLAHVVVPLTTLWVREHSASFNNELEIFFVASLGKQNVSPTHVRGIRGVSTLSGWCFRLSLR